MKIPNLAPDLKLLLGLEDDFLLLGPPPPLLTYFSAAFWCQSFRKDTMAEPKSRGRRLFASPCLGLIGNFFGCERWFPVGIWLTLKISRNDGSYLSQKKSRGMLFEACGYLWYSFQKNGVPLIMFSLSVQDLVEIPSTPFNTMIKRKISEWYGTRDFLIICQPFMLVQLEE